MTEFRKAVSVGLIAAIAGCVGGEPRPGDTSSAATQTRAESATTTGANAPVANTRDPQIAEGDSIFHGQKAGGLCQSCHGPDAKGTQLAPNLTDTQWLNGDGSLQFIVRTITSGIPTPKQHPAPMPPMGGAQLTPEQINAVAAYVYSLSHPRN